MKFQQPEKEARGRRKMSIEETPDRSQLSECGTNANKSFTNHRRAMSAKPIRTSSLTIVKSSGNAEELTSLSAKLKSHNEQFYHSSRATSQQSFLEPSMNSTGNGKLFQLRETDNLPNLSPVLPGAASVSNYLAWRAEQIVVYRSNDAFLQKYGSTTNRLSRADNVERNTSVPAKESGSISVHDEPTQFVLKKEQADGLIGPQNEKGETPSSSKNGTNDVDDEPTRALETNGDGDNEEDQQVITIKKGILKKLRSQFDEQPPSRPETATQRKFSHDHIMSLSYSTSPFMSGTHNASSTIVDDFASSDLSRTHSVDMMDARRKKTVRFLERLHYSDQPEVCISEEAKLKEEEEKLEEPDAAAFSEREFNEVFNGNEEVDPPECAELPESGSQTTLQSPEYCIEAPVPRRPRSAVVEKLAPKESTFTSIPYSHHSDDQSTYGTSTPQLSDQTVTPGGFVKVKKKMRPATSISSIRIDTSNLQETPQFANGICQEQLAPVIRHSVLTENRMNSSKLSPESVLDSSSHPSRKEERHTQKLEDKDVKTREKDVWDDIRAYNPAPSSTSASSKKSHQEHHPSHSTLLFSNNFTKPPNDRSSSVASSEIGSIPDNNARTPSLSASDVAPTPTELSRNSSLSISTNGSGMNRSAKNSISGSIISTFSGASKIIDEYNIHTKDRHSKPMNWRETHRKLLQQRDDNAAKLRRVANTPNGIDTSDQRTIEPIHFNKSAASRKIFPSTDADSSPILHDYPPALSSANRGATVGAGSLNRPVLLNAWDSPLVSYGNGISGGENVNPPVAHAGVYSKLPMKPKYSFSSTSSRFSYSPQLLIHHNKAWNKNE